MKGSILFVGAAPTLRRLIDLLQTRHIVVTCGDSLMGCAHAQVGRFDVVVASPLAVAEVVSPVCEARGLDVVTADESDDGGEVVRRIEEAIAASQVRAVARARSNAILARLSYRELLDHTRARASYEYLTALLAAHDGCVTDAATASRIERESLHRLLRLHHIRADVYRTNPVERS